MCIYNIMFGKNDIISKHHAGGIEFLEHAEVIFLIS